MAAEGRWTDGSNSQDESVIERALQEFEAVWRNSATRPRIEEFLDLAPADGDLRSQLLNELLIVELNHRVGAGEAPTVSEYCSRFPQDTDLVELVFVLREAREPLAGVMESGESGVSTAGPEGAIPLASRIGPYRLLELVGKGGMGEVYLAAQEEPIRRHVALKLIKLGMDTRQVIARFEAERQALALMDHPHIAKVHDAGATPEGRPYFVMEFVQGLPVTAYCDRHQLDIRARLAIFLQVCHAIQHAHQKGIIHRDLKPANILVSAADGHPIAKIIDFGLAKATNQRLTEKTIYTEVGRVIGTLAYMSPEQADSSSEDIDDRTDIFSLGVVLYELLVGEPPLDQEALNKTAFDEILRRIREEDPPTPSMRLSQLNLETTSKLAKNRTTSPGALKSALRGDLDWICMKALEKSRVRRYATATRLAEDIERYLRNDPVLAGAPSALYRVQRFIRKHRGPVVAAGALFAVLLAGVVASTTLYFQANTAKTAESEKTKIANQALEARGLALKEKEQERQRAELLKGVAEAGRRKATRILYGAHMRLGGKSWEEGHGERALDLLARYFPDRTDEDWRQFEWYYLYRLCHGDLATLRADSGNAWGTCFSPDGRKLAVAYGEGTVMIWSTATRQVVSALPQLHSVWCVSYSPAGELLAAGGGQGHHRPGMISLWDPDLGTLRHSWQTQLGAQAIAFSPDGACLAVGGSTFWDAQELSTGALQIFNVPEGSLRQEIVGLKCSITSVAYCPDGQRLVCGSWDGVVRVFDVNRGEMSASVQASSGVHSLSVSADGGILAVAGRDHSIKLWHLPGLEPLRSPLFGGDQTYAVALAPDGQTLAAGGPDTTVHIWDLASGNTVASLRGHNNWIWCLAYSPDGKTLATGDRPGVVKLWDLRATNQADRFKAHGHKFLAPYIHGRSIAVLSPDGSSVAIARSDAVSIQDVRSGEVKHSLVGHRGEVNALAVSSDGSSLVTGGRDGAVRLWDLETAESRPSLPPHGDEVTSVAFSALGTAIITGAKDRTVQLRPATDGGTVVTFRVPGDPGAVAISPDGKLAAAALEECPDNEGYPAVWVWSPEREEPHRKFVRYGLQRACDVEFSPDGKLLAIAGGNHFHGQQAATTAVIDLESGVEIQNLQGHIGYVTSIAFAETGDTLLSGGDDGTLHLWDTSTWEERFVLQWTGHRIDTVDISANGRVLVAGDTEGSVRVWYGAEEREVKESHEQAEAWDLLRQAVTRSRGGDVQGALADATRAGRGFADPAWKSLSLHQRAHLLDDLKRSEEAGADYRAAIDLSPLSIDVRHCAAKHFRGLGQWERAFAELAATLEIRTTQLLGCESMEGSPWLPWIRHALTGEDSYREHAFSLLESAAGTSDLAPVAFWSLRELKEQAAVVPKAILAEKVSSESCHRLYALALGVTWPTLWRGLEERTSQGVVKTRLLGGRAGEYFVDTLGNGLLVGVEAQFVGVGHLRTLRSLRPLFITAEGLVKGAMHGKGGEALLNVEARPGYAVGGLLIRGDERVTGLQLEFMKIQGSGLDRRDSYRSPWIGEYGTLIEEQMSASSGDGVVGLAGMSDDQIVGLQLVLPGSCPPDQAAIDAVLAAPVVLLPRAGRWSCQTGPAPRTTEWTELGHDTSDWAVVGLGKAPATPGSFPVEGPMVPGDQTSLRVVFRNAYPGEQLAEMNLRIESNGDFSVFLNGKQVKRVTICDPASWFPHELPALGVRESNVLALGLPIDRALLKLGDNVLALELRGPQAGRQLGTVELSATVVPGSEADQAMLRRLAESVPAGEAAGRVDYIRGLSLARRGEVKPAGEFFRQAAAASPRFAEPILRWVECLRDQGRFAEASSVLGDALSAGLQSSRRGWQAWLEVLFGDLGFTAREVLAAFPRMDTWMPVASEQEAFIKALAANEAVSLVCGASEASREPGAFAVPGSPARGYRMPMPRGRYRCTLDSGDCARRDCVWPVFDFLVEDKALAVNHGPGISTLRPVDRRAVTVEVVDGGLDIEFRHGSGLAHGFALTVQAEDKLDSTAAVEGNDGLPVENGDSSLEGGLRMSFLGRELEAAERWNEAECAYRQAMNLFESESGEARQDTAHAHLAHACFLLGQLLRRMGRSEQATELTAKAIAWNPEYGLPEELKSYPAIEAMIAGEVLPQGSSWRFRSGRETVAGEWAAPEFDDASWQEGASAFGYGTAGVGTELSDMQGNYTTVYLRKSFQLEEADLDARLRLEVTADDGFVAYLNGIEVARARAGAKGAILGSAATASENVREPVEPQVTEVPGEALRPGTNVLAIQGLNVAKESSDFTLLPVLRWEAPPAPDYEQDRLRLQHVLAGARGEIGRCRVAYVEGRLLQRVGRHREAVTRLSEALAHDGRHREPLVRAAESQRALGEARLAMTHLARALQQSGEEEADEILRSWFLVAAVDLGLDARSLRAELPAVGRESSGRYGADLRWALDRLIDEGALRLNCGGEEFRGKAGMVWGKDRFFLGGYRFYGDGIGGATSPFTDDIRETDDDPLYQTERWFPTQEIERALYRIPLPRGKYRVTLHFAEIYFRVQRVRVFDVMLEDRKVMESYDPSTPGFAVAQKHGFVVSVDDGELDIRFLERTDAPKISAIEVVRDN